MIGSVWAPGFGNGPATLKCRAKGRIGAVERAPGILAVAFAGVMRSHRIALREICPARELGKRDPAPGMPSREPDDSLPEALRMTWLAASALKPDATCEQRSRR